MRAQDIPILKLAGTPKQNGRIHGEALRGGIAGVLEQWRATTALPLNLSFDAFIELFLAETAFVEQMQRHTPSLLDEIAGIAEGANQSQKLMLAFQFGDEARWFLRDRFATPASRADRCSSLAAVSEAGASTILAQNIDVGSWADGAQTVLRISDPKTGGETLIFTVAGMIGMNGLSGNGIALCCNTLLQLDPDPAGLPVAAVLRRTLASKSFQDAVGFLQNVSHASGQNYLLGGRHNIANFECSAGGAVLFRLNDRSDRVIHTNHPLQSTATDRFDTWCRTSPGELNTALETSSRKRLQSLTKRFASSRGGCTADEAIAALSARDDPEYPVCRATTTSGWMTIGATIFEIGERVTMHVAAGPPSECDFINLEAAASSF
jgi:hypothetical protein